jgi:hypothetical protein
MLKYPANIPELEGGGVFACEAKLFLLPAPGKRKKSQDLHHRSLSGTKGKKSFELGDSLQQELFYHSRVVRISRSPAAFVFGLRDEITAFWEKHLSEWDELFYP